MLNYNRATYANNKSCKIVLKFKSRGWDYSLVPECLPSISMTLGSIPNTTKKATNQNLKLKLLLVVSYFHTIFHIYIFVIVFRIWEKEKEKNTHFHQMRTTFKRSFYKDKSLDVHK